MERKIPPFSVSLVTITPELATELLAKNTINRKPNRGTVVKYAKTIEQGRWEVTSDLIAFAGDGTLLNGQHRLLAVVESGRSCDMVIAEGVDKEAFAVMDRGRPRAYSFALGIDKKLAESARLLASGSSGGATSSLTDKEIEDAAEFLYDAHHRLMESCGASRKGLTTAAIRLGYCLQYIYSGGDDYVMRQYGHFVRGDVEKMSPLVLSAWKRIMTNGTLRSSDGGSGQRFECESAFTFSAPEKKHQTRFFTSSDYGKEAWNVYKQVKRNAQEAQSNSATGGGFRQGV